MAHQARQQSMPCRRNARRRKLDELASVEQPRQNTGNLRISIRTNVLKLVQDGQPFALSSVPGNAPAQYRTALWREGIDGFPGTDGRLFGEPEGQRAYRRVGKAECLPSRGLRTEGSGDGFGA